LSFDVIASYTHTRKHWHATRIKTSANRKLSVADDQGIFSANLSLLEWRRRKRGKERGAWLCDSGYNCFECGSSLLERACAVICSLLQSGTCAAELLQLKYCLTPAGRRLEHRGR